MTRYLLLVTIGPVQEFIAAARRSRDLWSGSELLSTLSREAAQFLRDQGATLIFPAQEDLSRHDVVNRILADVATAPETLGAAVEAHVRTTLHSRAADILGAVPGLKDVGTLPQALAQVDDLLEVFWAGVERTASYGADREAVEAALAARKTTRDFVQPAHQQMVPKSSIDGQRDSVIPEELYPRGVDGDDQRQEKIQRLFQRFGAGQAERLSGVDLLKRHLRGTGGETDFPSTSHFAALPIITRRYGKDPKTRSHLDKYLDTLRAAYDATGQRLEQLRLSSRFHTEAWTCNFDASILFASRLEEELAGDGLKQSRLALTTYLREGLGGEPGPYYAILHADGDHMGKVIDHQTQGGIEQHQAFSRDLDAFADSVRGIVEDGKGNQPYRGALVYAGGDDVLALLPLDTVLPCATELAQRFAQTLRGYESKEGKTPTLSVGIAICHHIEPLSDALELARKTEKAAKRTRNAVAVTLSKRSGVDTTIGGEWQSGFPGRLERFIALHQDDAIPDGAAFDLRDLDERVGQTLDPAALVAEALRILQRKRGRRGEAAILGPDIQLVADALAAGVTKRRRDGRPVWGVNELADELIVAREFARARGINSDERRSSL